MHPASAIAAVCKLDQTPAANSVCYISVAMLWQQHPAVSQQQGECGGILRCTRIWHALTETTDNHQQPDVAAVHYQGFLTDCAAGRHFSQLVGHRMLLQQ
jgi:hypothetical protein